MGDEENVFYQRCPIEAGHAEAVHLLEAAKQIAVRVQGDCWKPACWQKERNRRKIIEPRDGILHHSRTLTIGT